MASLLSLPPEIQTHIISLLIPPSGPSIQSIESVLSIHAVLKTCKQLYDVALPLSVHTYCRPILSQSEAPASSRSRSRILQFLRYVAIIKPELANCVKAIVLQPVNVLSYDSEVQDPDLGGDERDLYRNLIESVVTPGSVPHHERARERWLEDLDAGLHDAERALLLVACPNVEAFSFAQPESYGTDHLSLLLNIASRAQARHDGRQDQHSPPSGILSHLSHFYHEGTDEKYGYVGFAAVAAQAFQLPSLRSYVCVLANGSDDVAEFFAAIPRHSSHIESISLLDSSVSAVALPAILGACKALRSFEYTRGLYHMYNLEFMPRDLTQTILPFASTLEHLHVNYDDSWHKVGWETEPQRIPMGLGLRRMTALRKLVTGMQALTGMLDAQPQETFGDRLPLEVDGAPTLIECLPENLVHLAILDCGKPMLPQTQELLDAITTGRRFKRLKRIYLVFDPVALEREDVQLVCGAPGVELEIVF
jgi:hypothetical protein